MVQQLKVLAALTNDSCLIPDIHMAAHNPPELKFRDLIPLWAFIDIKHIGGTYAHRQANIK